MNSNEFNVRFPGVTYYDHFEYQGKRYPLGTVVMLQEPYNSRWSGFYNTEVTILDHCLDCGKENYCISNGYNLNKDIIYHTITASPDKWIKEIVKNPKTVVATKIEPQYEKDSENDDVKFGWVLYILAMLFLLIFKDRWIGWIAVSAYFFTWRRNKLKK